MEVVGTRVLPERTAKLSLADSAAMPAANTWICFNLFTVIISKAPAKFFFARDRHHDADCRIEPVCFSMGKKSVISV